MARATNCQFSPAPATELTVFPPDPESVEMNASNNSLGADVENCPLESKVSDDERSDEDTVSIASNDGVPGELTVNVAFAAWLSDEPLAVMVIGYVPTGVEMAVVIVSCELPDPVSDCGLKLAVAPVGKPLRVKFVADA